MKSAVWACAVLCSLMFLTAGCKDSTDISGPVKGSGNIVSQTRNVDKFTMVDLYKAGNVHIIQDQQESVRVEADDNVIDKVITNVQNGTLMTGLGDSGYKDVTVNIFVSMETIDRVILEGAGNITVHNSIESDTLDCLLAGAGNITLQGQGSLFSCTLSGAGNIFAENFKSKSCIVKLSGTGNCNVFASSDIDALLAGVGNIFYYGNPPNVKTKISGTGQITKR